MDPLGIEILQEGALRRRIANDWCCNPAYESNVKDSARDRLIVASACGMLDLMLRVSGS